MPSPKLTRIVVDMNRETFQHLADFLGAATFETFASCSNGKVQAYEMRDAVAMLLGSLGVHGFKPRTRESVESSSVDTTTPSEKFQLQFAQIPLRYLPLSTQRHVQAKCLEDIRSSIAKGTSFPTWCVSDFDMQLVAIGLLPTAGPPLDSIIAAIDRARSETIASYHASHDYSVGYGEAKRDCEIEVRSVFKKHEQQS